MNYLLLFEEYQKMKWELITSDPEKEIEGKRLIEIVDIAYRNTNLGSFVKTMSDVLKSHWLVIDCDEYDDIDACIFYRQQRTNENWKGAKIQGIGHDGDYKAKRILMNKLIKVLNHNDGYWIEASGILESILNDKGVKKVTDKETLSKLFPDSKIEFIENGQYKRTLEDGSWVTETVFGNPKF